MFEVENEADPQTTEDLFRIGCSRLQEIKYDVEESDNSLRGEVHKDDDEIMLRKWFARKLNDRSRKRYTAIQEEEIESRQRPDIRLETPGLPPVSIEIKWAEEWTLPRLLERLEQQLVGQYMRDYKVRCGVYLLGYIGRKVHWEDPAAGKRRIFPEVVEILERRAAEIAETDPRVSDLRVMGIDFRASS
jgi:hypothetical protein